MISIRSVILPRGPLTGLVVVTVIVLGIEKFASFVIDAYTIIDPHVSCTGKSLEPGDERMTLNLECGGKKTYTYKAKVIARYVARPKVPIICTLQKTGDISCDE